MTTRNPTPRSGRPAAPRGADAPVMLLMAALLLALWLCAGCSTPSALTAVHAANARWEHATGCDPIGLPRGGIFEQWGRFPCGDDAPGAVGCYNQTRDRITLDVSVSPALVEHAATHEVGHRLGVQHGPAGTMMADSISAGVPCITRQDVERVCSAGVVVCQWDRAECP